jgi:hypothetical protein
MLKPLRGAAGRGIRIWDDPGWEQSTPQEPYYFHERRVGDPISALFLAQPRQATLLGIARQLIGLREVHAPPFAWCGTIAPLEIPPETTAMIALIGDVLAQQTGLCGLFGCDFIIEHGKPWLTEVNPRYPASTELVERVLRAPLLDWHRRACESLSNSGCADVVSAAGGMGRHQSLEVDASNEHCGGVIGKIVLYASREVVAPDAMRFVRLPTHSRLVETAADIPTWVICNADAAASAEEELTTRGVEVLRAPASAEGRIDAAAALRLLAARGIVTMMVEGGAELAGSFLAWHLADELHAFVAPILLGPRGRPGAVDWAGPDTPAEAPKIVRPSWELCGEDAYVHGTIEYPERQG